MLQVARFLLLVDPENNQKLVTSNQQLLDFIPAAVSLLQRSPYRRLFLQALSLLLR